MPSPFRRQTRAELTSDAVLSGSVRFEQPLSGYRVNVDSILLAAFAAQGRRARVAVDLGAGVGLVALLLARHAAADELILVEQDPRLAALAEKNLKREGVLGKVLCIDLEHSGSVRALAQCAELVVSNPPFFEEARHRPPRDAASKRARVGRLGPFLAAACTALSGAKARAVFVYPAASLTEFFGLAAGRGLVPKRLRLVHAFQDRPARVALVELRKARPGGLVVEAPLIEWDGPGRPTSDLIGFSSGKIAGRE